MKAIAIKVWKPEDGDEPERRNCDGFEDPEHAAEWYAEECYFGGDDHPEEQEIHVRMSDGTLRRYTVDAEAVMNFSAYENEEKA